jgi:hypothetical protein
MLQREFYSIAATLVGLLIVCSSILAMIVIQQTSAYFVFGIIAASGIAFVIDGIRSCNNEA